MANSNANTPGHISYNGILKYIGIFGSVQLLQILMSVVRNKCAALLVGRIGMGFSDILNRTTDMFSALSNLGISTSGVKEVASGQASGNARQIETTISAVRIWSLATGLVGTLLCALLGETINTLFFNRNLPCGFIAAVSPVVGFMALYGGEAAVLKGTRNLKRLATATASGSALSLAATIAFYALLGINGIPLALLTGAAFLATAALIATRKVFPWKASVFTRSSIDAGRALLTIGISYTAAGLAGTGAEMLVRAFIARGSMADVGLYAAGFVICVTYARLVFVAMDADYFPRLAATGNNISERNITVSKQIDVCTMLMGPVLIGQLLLLPLIINILYTPEFKEATAMCITATGYLFVKAIIAPIEYIPLARGDSKTYFFMELAYDAIFTAAVAVGYRLYGVAGAGAALTFSYIADLAMVVSVYRYKYGLRINNSTATATAIQAVMVAVATAVFATGYETPQYAAGAIVLGFSAAFSLRKLKLTPNKIWHILKKRLQKS